MNYLTYNQSTYVNNILPDFYIYKNPQLMTKF